MFEILLDLSEAILDIYLAEISDMTFFSATVIELSMGGSLLYHNAGSIDPFALNCRISIKDIVIAI